MLKSEIDIVLFVKKIRLIEAFLVTKFDLNTESHSQSELKVIEVPLLDDYDNNIVVPVQELIKTPCETQDAPEINILGNALHIAQEANCSDLHLVVSGK